ncbi:hypothetical protein IH799_03805 [candidate division KSB1 bacterium]|nr:hypothetical protein [candidate division KSB1 bacterium]
MITTDVGVQNRAVFKIYENSGPQNIKHFALGFGLAQGEIIANSKTIIEWDKSWNGKETLSVIDPQNALDNVKVTAWPGPCRSDSNFNKDCLIVTVYHTFRQPLDFNIVSTNVWDFKLNAWQNYYNDGVEVQGESLNPPAQYVGIHEGHLVTITETGKNTAIDADGNTWTLDNTWTMDYIPNKKIVDGVSTKWIDRNNAWFNAYKKGQELIAQEKLDAIHDGKLAYFDNLDEPQRHYSEFLKRSEDFELQQRIYYEQYKAYQVFKDLFPDIKSNY